MDHKELTFAESKDYDLYVENEQGYPGILLMENAGHAVASKAHTLLENNRFKFVYVLCGGGNNGGDGLCAARFLLFNGYKVKTFIFKNKNLIEGNAAVNLAMIENLKPEILFFDSFTPLPEEQFSERGVIIDALLGAGMKFPFAPGLEGLIEFINNTGYPVISVDIPTGFDPSVLGGDKCVKADETVTMFAPKTGMRCFSAKKYVGNLTVVDPRFRIL